jgi:hypothetical protein
MYANSAVGVKGDRQASRTPWGVGFLIPTRNPAAYAARLALLAGVALADASPPAEDVSFPVSEERR